MKLTAVLCLVSTATGVYKLFGELIKKDGVSAPYKNTVLMIVLLTITGPYIWGATNVYDGGGMLMLAYCPWFIYGVIKYGSIKPTPLIVILIAALAGFFIKASFTPVMAGAVAYLYLIRSVNVDQPLKAQNFKLMIRNGLILFLMLVVYMVITKVFYLDHNRNISGSSLGIRVQPRVVFFPIAAPLINILPTTMFNRTAHWIVASLLVIPGCYFVLKSKRLNLRYKYAIVAFGGAYLLFYAMLFFLNVDVSYDTRHFSVLTALIAPAVFLALPSTKAGQYIAATLAALLFIMNVSWFVNCFVFTQRTGNAFDGIATGYPDAITAKLASLDQASPHGKDIFYFKSSEPTIALLIKQNRVLLEDNFVNFHFDNAARTKPVLYYGTTAGNLYITYADANFKQDSVTYLTRFERYKKFDKIFCAGGYTIYKGVATDKAER